MDMHMGDMDMRGLIYGISGYGGYGEYSGNIKVIYGICMGDIIGRGYYIGRGYDMI